MWLALYGGLAAGNLAVAALFLRLWSRNRSPLLASFAGAFALVAASYALQCGFQAGLLPRAPAFLIRLSAFLIIIAGIVWTNLNRSK